MGAVTRGLQADDSSQHKPASGDWAILDDLTGRLTCSTPQLAAGPLNRLELKPLMRAV